MGGVNDFFSENFDMTKYPTDFKTEEGKKERELLSCFFRKLRTYYEKYIISLGKNTSFFMLNKPFNLLYGIYNEKIFLGISSDNALRGRTGVYKINNSTVLNLNSMTGYCNLCGFGENTVIADIPIELILNSNTDLYDDRIDQETKKLADYELEKLERKFMIMRINPIFGDKEFIINEKKAFMLMPLEDSELNVFYEDHIKTVVKEVNMHCIRADDIFNNKSIIDDIWRNINEARIIIADLTNRNPNVFYEVGIAHTLGKEVILISQNENDIPFDLKYIRAIFYKNTSRGAKEFESNLKETIKAIIEPAKIQ